MTDIYFERSLALHPSMQPQDVVKFCFQAVFGAEHLLADPDRVYGYLIRELDETEAEDMPLYEEISPVYSRVNLAAWKYKCYPAKTLFDAFMETAGTHSGSEEELREKLDSFAGEFPGLKDFLEEYYKNGIGPVHHSDIYRAAEKPAYRVVRTELIPAPRTV